MILTSLLWLAIGTQHSKTIHEPDWSHSALKDPAPAFVKIHSEVEKRFGVIPEDTRSLDSSEANAALAAYETSHTAASAFRAVYLQLTTKEGAASREFKGGIDPFKDMPKDDYEVARLHFLWSWTWIDNQLKPLGERLVKKNPNDVEVLWVYSHLCSHSGIGDQEKGLKLAERAMKLFPGPRTYMRYADARGMMKLVRPASKSEDYKVARQYYEKFLSVAGKNDPDREEAVRAVNWLKAHGY